MNIAQSNSMAILRALLCFLFTTGIVYIQNTYSLSLITSILAILITCGTLLSVEILQSKKSASDRLITLEQSLNMAATAGDLPEAKLAAKYAQGWRQEKSDLEHRLNLIAKDVNRDSLTGLPNRASFIHQLSLLPENSAKHWLALIHATPMAELNQRGGSKLGDLFIQEIAEQLTLHGLPLGQLYRFEGAMFAWVASAHQIEQPEHLAERCAQALEQLAQRHQITRAANIAFISFYGNQWGAALNQAEESLQIVSSLPHRCWQVDHTEQPQVDDWFSELDQQISNADVEFNIQTTLSVNDNMPRYHELFSRFTFSKGTMSTDKVIAMAEYHGRMAQLDMMLLTKITPLLQNFKGDGVLAVNLGFHTINEPQFLHWLTQYLQKNPAITTHLVMEIQTDAIQTYSDNAAKLISLLHQHGVRVCLCHFGQQLDGLASLSRFKPSFVKLDPRYTRDIDADKSLQQVLRLFIDTLHRLGTKIIAENVEKQEDKSMLAELHVDAIQGYIVAKPIPVQNSELLRMVS